MPTRQRLARIEARPKKIEWAEGCRVDIDVKGRIRAPLSSLLSMIERGLTIDDAFYRSNVDVDQDRLLDHIGIMHIHLGSSKSEELVYLIQYSSKVVILAVSDHRYIEERPAAKSLRALKIPKDDAASLAPAPVKTLTVVTKRRSLPRKRDAP